MVFAFFAELVMRGWYDEIEMVFGPVGHTHNGNDAVHFVHNNIAGNYVSITPAELFHNYKYAWHDATTRPQPVIMECQYDWQSRYLPYLRGVQGFTSTTNDEAYVRAFRFTRNEDGQCEMHFKGSPSCPEWFGANSVPNTRGYPILRGVPDGMPLYKNPTDYTIPKEYVTRLGSSRMKEYAASNGRAPMHDYLMRMARTMTVPSLGIATKQYLASLDDVRKSRMSGWGTVEWIGVAACVTIAVPFVRRKKHTPATFWLTPDLPPATAALSHSQLRQVPTPLVTEVRQPRAPRKKATGTPASTAKNKRKTGAEAEAQEISTCGVFLFLFLLFRFGGVY